MIIGTPANKKIGIALGGGGAKGFAHIGVLQVLEEAGIHGEFISGTSIGALVGAVYSSGNLDNLVSAAKKIRLTDIPLLLSPTVSRKGIFSGKKTLGLLGQQIKAERIEDLDKCFAAVAVDLRSGQAIVFDSGSIVEAVRASIAIPLLFTPVLKDGRILVDGGLVEPLPVAACRALGAEFIIAVDLFADNPQTAEEIAKSRAHQSTLWPAGISTAISYLQTVAAKLPWGEVFISQQSDDYQSPTMISIFENTLALSQRELTRCRLTEHPADILITPPVSSVGLLDFHRGEAIIELGKEAATAMLPAIRKALGINKV